MVRREEGKNQDSCMRAGNDHFEMRRELARKASSEKKRKWGSNIYGGILMKTNWRIGALSFYSMWSYGGIKKVF